MLPVGEAGLRLGDEIPVDAALEQRAERERDVDLRIGVGRPGLDHRHPDVRILAEPGGEDTARPSRHRRSRSRMPPAASYDRTARNTWRGVRVAGGHPRSS